METKKLLDQMEAINQVFHKLWFAIVCTRPDYKFSKDQKLSFLEMHLIGLASDNPKIIIKELREYLNVPQTTLSSIITKLEKGGYIRRIINHRDLRSFSLEVTQKGEKIGEIHKQNDLMQARNALLALDEEDRDSFVKMFQKIGNAFCFINK